MQFMLFDSNYIRGEYHLKVRSIKSEHSPKVVPTTIRGFTKQSKRLKERAFEPVKKITAPPDVNVLVAQTKNKGESPFS